MCRVLKVSRSSYYDWLSYGGLAISDAKSMQMKAVKDCFYKHKRRYGSPRIYRDLKASGFAICKTTVEDIMKILGLRAKSKRKYRSAPTNHCELAAPNILKRSFGETRRDRVWLSDITYLGLGNQGFVFLCALMDMASREIVGWHLDRFMDTGLVITALKNAVAYKNIRPRGTIFHSDQGRQYISSEFREQLSHYGFKQSMSRRGQCWDNAPMESFFASMKTEISDELKAVKTLAQMRTELFSYIETYYNRKRIHSGIGYQVPACYVA